MFTYEKFHFNCINFVGAVYMCVGTQLLVKNGRYNEANVHLTKMVELGCEVDYALEMLEKVERL